MISKLIGEKIKQRREELNLAPKAVAAELCKSPRAYLDMEAGLVDIKESDLICLKCYLKISVAAMFNEEHNNNYNVSGNTTQSGNVGVNYGSKDLLDKIAELYEGIIVLEKK